MIPESELQAIEARYQPDNETWTVKTVRTDIPALLAEVRRLQAKEAAAGCEAV